MYINNIDHQKVQTLTALVNVMPGQIVSRTLAQNKAVSITLFAFDKGTEISTHESTGDAMVQVLEGTGCFTVDGKEYLVHPGEVLVMPANVPHAVSAPEAFKWVLTVVFPKGFKKEWRICRHFAGRCWAVSSAWRAPARLVRRRRRRPV